MKNTNPEFQPVTYAGGLYDSDTKLIRFGARDYDPTIGRWTTKDPIGFAGGDTNLYAYVGGNPMSYNDPSGLKILDLSGDARVKNLSSNSLYRNLAVDPNVLVVITSQNLPNGTFGVTTGNQSLIKIALSPEANINNLEFNNTLIHELIHADQIRSGNFSYTDPRRRDFNKAEESAYDYANKYYPSRLTCP